MPRQTIIIAKWLTRFCKPVLTIVIVSLLLSFSQKTLSWRQLAKGLEYQELGENYLTPWSHIHAFRINLQSNQLALVMAKELSEKYASAEEFSGFSKALITINGGFFDENFRPLGLRITNKQQVSPLKQISWWGVFYIKDNKAYISNVGKFHRSSQIEFALQSGPRLLINGKIPQLKPGRAKRTALGITKDGDVIILVTDNALLSTTELAQVMKAAPLNCYNALNLDGGGSSQLHAQINAFQLDVHGFSNVSDAVIVKAKN